MKMMNFRRFDPNYTSTGRVGLTRGNKNEQAIWQEFATDTERLVRVADAIRQALLIVQDQGKQTDEFDEGIVEVAEGRLLTRLHLIRERNRKLVERRKLRALRELGHLRCEACEFDFEVCYGARGRGFIEAHDVQPIETLAKSATTKAGGPCPGMRKLPSNDSFPAALAQRQCTSRALE
jgi:predicted HNH restriction endonuclease